MAAMQRLRLLNPFKKVTRVANRAPFLVFFMVTRAEPEGPNAGWGGHNLPAFVDFFRRIPSGREIQFDPGILDPDPHPPQLIYVTDPNPVELLDDHFLELDPDILRNNAKVTIDINQAERQLFAEGQEGTRLQRTQALMKVKIAHKKLKNKIRSRMGSLPVHIQEPPPPPAPDAPPQDEPPPPEE